MHDHLLIFGAGGHGKVAADVALESGRWKKISFLDDNPDIERKVLDCDVLGKRDLLSALRDEFGAFHVGVGDNATRIALLDEAKSLGYEIPALVHPNASVSQSAKVGAGCLVVAQAAVNPCAVIGTGCIVNTGAIVEHDCTLGPGSNLSPNATLGGRSKIGDRTFLGLGAIVLPKVAIGKDVVVGAGAVVVTNLPDRVTAIGVPAKITVELQL